MSIFIKGNVPSSKNSKRWVGNRLINSETVENYKEKYDFQFKDPIKRDKFKLMLVNKTKPYKIGFYFIRNSKRRFDYINIAQLPLDLMVKYDWLEDDNANIVNPIFLGYEVDKEKAGMIIKIL